MSVSGLWSWWVQKISVEFELFAGIVEFMKFEGFLELVELKGFRGSWGLSSSWCFQG